MTNDIDAHLGARLRQRRWMLGLTQTQVGDRVGIKFQQVQKYETGQNRISAGRLYELGRALDVPPAYFFDGFEEAATDASPEFTAPQALARPDPLNDRETVEAARSIAALSPLARAKLVEFLRALASDDGQQAAAERGPRLTLRPKAPSGAGPTPPRRKIG